MAFLEASVEELEAAVVIAEQRMQDQQIDLGFLTNGGLLFEHLDPKPQDGLNAAA
jgi:hypothetical protein